MTENTQTDASLRKPLQFLRPTKLVMRRNQYERELRPTRVPNPSGIAVLGLGALLGIICLFGFYNVDAGERAVEHNTWAAEFTVTDEGLHWRFPLSTKVTVYDVKVHKEESIADSATFDLQQVTTTIAVQFRPDHGAVLNIHRELGSDYQSKVFSPAVQEAVKSCTAHYTYEGLIQNRTEAKICMANIIRDRMEENYLVVHNVDIVNFEPPSELSAAITAKEVAKQEALKQQNLLAAREYEAQQKVVAAQAEADAARIIGEQVAIHGDAYLFLQWLEAWQHGGSQVPKTLITGGNEDVPFLINVPSE